MAKNPLNSIPTRASPLGRFKTYYHQESWSEFYDIYSNLIYRVAVAAGLTLV